MEINRSRFQVIRNISLLVLIILLILLLVDSDEMREALRQIDWGEFAVGVLFLVAVYVLTALRTRFLVRDEIGYTDTLGVDSSGLMFSILIQIPNAAFRALALKRSAGVEFPTITSALSVETITGLLVRSIGIVFAIALVASNQRDAERPILNSILVAVVIVGIIFLLARNSERVASWLKRGLVYIPRVTSDRAEGIASGVANTLEQMASVRRFGLALLLTFIIWVASLLFYLYSFQALNVESTVPDLYIPLAVMAVAPPTSPAMIGIFHGAVIAVLGTLRLLETDLAAAYAIELHLVQMALLLILGVIGMRRLKIDFREIIGEIRGRSPK
ncbi:MAG: lysylphosphatidylglycerol synthase transmembrane domain-containing protein [Anaerolineales bacterium]|nr:lysylphosphatidylglycerol synthase transmembrane domain-containing protein [Anaerolineales bacterium]